MSFQLELPDIGEGIVEAEIQKWFVAPGDAVVEDQPLVEVMTDKATVTIPSPRRGKVVKLFWKEGDLAKVHAPLIELELEGAAKPAPAPATSPLEKVAQPSPSVRPEPVEGRSPAGATALGLQESASGARKALAAPAVRAMARELGIDINAVGGTGPGGRVTKDDVQRMREGGRNGHAARGTVPQPPAPVSIPPSTGEERIPLRGVRRKIAENMARSKRTAAHFTFVEQCDATELVKLKARLADAAKAEGVKLTFLPFIVKATVAALKTFPQLNAALDEEKSEIVRKKHYDIGIASATEAGLTVPVIRGADRLSLLGLAREIDRLAEGTKTGKARPEDMGNSTFTITSLGALGGVFATPVLNHPEVGILGIHRIRPTPVVRDGQIVVRDVMHVSLTSDHRVVDGHEAAKFTYEVIRYLEDPNLLFLQMA
ncbi:MAG TPA: dihydrolipoamide acetyltransferase family protein [Anaeromyxobacteraceae bacterium]|nr:dihydrolipoamide acetyltransferase family protein [Anaeromyxobacteraceae bacterium]